MFKSCPNDKIFAWSKLKAFADKKLNVGIIIIYVFDREENIVGKGENASYQHFLLFLKSFQNVSSIGSLTLYHTIPTFKDPKEESFGKH